MSSDAELAQLVGRRPDPHLLDEQLERLPPGVGRPAPLVRDPRRAPIVGFGATMTGVSLIAGVALLIAGLVLAVGDGLHVLALAALAAGGLLAGTHWGWVHVAELTANSLEAGRNREQVAAREAWLARVEPYARWIVATSVRDDGSIAIERVCHRPVPVGEQRFTFVSELERSELHSGEEPGAQVAERAELLRREAATDTEHERLRYEAAADAYERSALEHADEEARLAALRAASQALSDQINANLREPPLVE